MAYKLKFIGKSLLIEFGGKKTLAIGDLHLGAGSRGEASGVIANRYIFEEIIGDLDKIFSEVGKIDRVVLLGDIKHSLSSRSDEERYDTINLIDHMERKTEEIVIVKGNHDNFLGNFQDRRVKVRDLFFDGGCCFIHGDEDFRELHEKKVKCWIMGHVHPAISLSEGPKVERFKCFLVGKYCNKEIIILPSFTQLNEGVDVRELERELKWKFNLDIFKVMIVGEGLEVLDFGTLKKLKS